MLVNRCKITIHTSLCQAFRLKYEASHQFHGVLKGLITERFSAWLASQQRFKPVTIERLTLNIGTLPVNDFGWQFVPRVLAALDEALNNLQLPDDEVIAGEAGFDESSAMASESPGFLDAPTSLVPGVEMQDRFLHYLRTGHWPPADCAAGKDNSPQGNMHSPARWLEAHLKKRQDPGGVLWSSLLTTLTEPYARQRLLACLSPALWLLWVQQLVPGLMTVGDVNNMREPDAINLLLLLWRYRVMSAMPDLPVMVHFSPAELELPSPAQCHDIEVLVLSPHGRSALRAQSGWLLRLVERFGERLWGRFTTQAQQQMLTMLPDMAPILRACLQKAGRSAEASGALPSLSPAEEVDALPPLSHRPSGSTLGGDRRPGQGNTSVDRQSLSSPARSSGQPPEPNTSAPPAQGAWPEHRPDERLKQGHTSVGRQSLSLPARGPSQPPEPNPSASPPQGYRPESRPGVTSEPVAVHHAGLVLLWPLLPRWLSSVGLLTPKSEEEKAPLVFASPQAQLEAIALLDSLVWQDGDGGEWRSLLGKLLCGCPLKVPLATWPSQERLDALRKPLEAQFQLTLQQLQQLQYMQSPTRPGLAKLTQRDLCQLFLQRSGTLMETRSGWQLTVTPHPADVMLWALPWPLEQIMFPWMTGVLDLNWEMPKLPFVT